MQATKQRCQWSTVVFKGLAIWRRGFAGWGCVVQALSTGSGNLYDPTVESAVRHDVTNVTDTKEVSTRCVVLAFLSIASRLSVGASGWAREGLQEAQQQALASSN